MKKFKITSNVEIYTRFWVVKNFERYFGTLSRHSRNLNVFAAGPSVDKLVGLGWNLMRFVPDLDRS